MKMKNNLTLKKMRTAFTLIELLVVVAVIGMLAAAIVSAIRGSGESARAANCLANMRALAQGANVVAMSNRWYPFAGSFQEMVVYNSKPTYKEHRGWISWLSNKGQFAGHPTQPVQVSNCQFDDDPDSDDARFAVQNGSMWSAVNKSSSTYVCPSHVRAFQKTHNGRSPIWSYVMNGYFGYDYSQGEKACGWGMRREYGQLERADRILMFAEIPTVDPETGGPVELSETMKDQTLSYHADVNGRSYGKGWKGTPEYIGFNHTAGKLGRCAHVVFADGHVEKLIHRTQGGLNDVQLTALLCEGRDISYDGKAYDEIKNTDR